MKITKNPLVAEILSPGDFEKLASNPEFITHMIGFNLNSRLNIGSAIITMAVIKDVLEMGGRPTILISDWQNKLFSGNSDHSGYLNYAMAERLKDNFKATAMCLGIEPEKIKIEYTSERYDRDSRTWFAFAELSRKISLSRLEEIAQNNPKLTNHLSTEMSYYSSMSSILLQVLDVFVMKANLIHSGVDLRDVSILAREVAEDLTVLPLLDQKGKVTKPVAVHHVLLPGLRMPLNGLKQSKPEDSDMVFFGDSESDIYSKIMKAYCPPDEVKTNPVLKWIEILVFGLGKEFYLIRDEKWGGDVKFKSFSDLEKSYLAGQIHPEDVKTSLVSYAIKLLEPAQKYLKGRWTGNIFSEKEGNKATFAAL